MNTLRKEARKWAEALHHAVGLTEPPVETDQIIEWLKNNLGFDIVVLPSKYYLSQNHLSGKLVRMTRRAIILINEKEPETRQRFTLGHEIGHLLENMQQAHMSQVMPSGYDKERFADVFASELLMPVELVRKEWSKLNGIHQPPVVQYMMAKIFVVSKEAMGYRLNELNLQSDQWAGTKIPPVYK